MPRLARRSRCVITNSAYSRGRIVRLLGLAADRVHAIPLGVSAGFRPVVSGERVRVASALGLHRPYFLAVGSLQPRKNLAGLFRAWERSGMSAHADLVIAGSDGRTFRGRGFDAVPAAVRFAGSLGDDDLPALYSGAVALVHLSLYEGFGLPMVEAMACGTPVIASNVTALPEVAGAAALLVAPTDPDAVAAALADVWHSEALREELGGRGLERARAFSWERAAEGTRAVLERARD